MILFLHGCHGMILLEVEEMKEDQMESNIPGRFRILKTRTVRTQRFGFRYRNDLRRQRLTVSLLIIFKPLLEVLCRVSCARKMGADGGQTFLCKWPSIKVAHLGRVLSLLTARLLEDNSLICLAALRLNQLYSLNLDRLFK